MGRLPSRGLRWCWFPIGELRRSCIRYDRSRRRLVCGQPWIGNPAGLKHVVKAEPEEAAYEHADSKIECDRYLASSVCGCPFAWPVAFSRGAGVNLNHYTQLLMPAYR
jgi:hypothetical protein